MGRYQVSAKVIFRDASDERAILDKLALMSPRPTRARRGYYNPDGYEAGGPDDVAARNHLPKLIEVMFDVDAADDLQSLRDQSDLRDALGKVMSEVTTDARVVFE